MTTWRAVRARYDRLRACYFLDAESPLRVPPPAVDVRWYWLPIGTRWHGVTHIDDDGDPDSVGLSCELARSDRQLTTVLLHELTHMRDVRAECPGPGRYPRGAWRREQLRLAALGAPLL